VPAVSIVAGVCGLLGFFLGPLLVGDTPDRYLVLALDLVALTAGGVGIRAALGRRARFDYSVLGILTGAVSLGLYVVYVANPPALPAGGT
jgi:FtsH-binding integral membrane protein